MNIDIYIYTYIQHDKAHENFEHGAVLSGAFWRLFHWTPVKNPAFPVKEARLTLRQAQRSPWSPALRLEGASRVTWGYGGGPDPCG